MDRVDVVVVGAGVVGLATARALALSGLEVLVLERAESFGTGVSSRSSEVVHAGLYYPPGSLKAQTCVRGRELLYAHCERAGVPYRRCGKLVVATSASQLAELETLTRRGAAAGVSDLQVLDGSQARTLEPELTCVAAVLSPSSGIVESHAFMLSLLGEAESHGAALVTRCPMQRATRDTQGWRIEAGNADAPFLLGARWLVITAGLQTQAVAACVDALPPNKIPRRVLAKGHYFALARKAPFSRLIYPIPQEGGLGIHLTLDLAGQARFGPDVQWLQDPPEMDQRDDAVLDYSVEPRRAPAFEEAVRSYWPTLPPNSLQPAYAGIRPKLSGPGQAPADFALEGPDEHGVPGLLVGWGLESPGLTASLALAEAFMQRLHTAERV